MLNINQAVPFFTTSGDVYTASDDTGLSALLSGYQMVQAPGVILTVPAADVNGDKLLKFCDIFTMPTTTHESYILDFTQSDVKYRKPGNLGFKRDNLRAIPVSTNPKILVDALRKAIVNKYDHFERAVASHTIGTGTGSNDTFYTKQLIDDTSTLVLKVNNVTKTIVTHFNITDDADTGVSKIVFTTGNLPAGGHAVTVAYTANQLKSIEAFAASYSDTVNIDQKKACIDFIGRINVANKASV